jgi:transposase
VKNQTIDINTQREILYLWKQSIPERGVAKKLHISVSDVRKIIREKATVSDARSRKTVFGSLRDVKIIRARRAGKTYQEIADMFNLSYGVVRTVINNHRPDLLSMRDGTHGNIVYDSKTRRSVVDYRVDGKSFKEIYSLTGVSPKSAQKYIKSMAPELLNKRLSEKDLKKRNLRIISLRELGNTYCKIGEKVGVATTTAYGVIKRDRPDLLSGHDTKPKSETIEKRIVELRREGVVYNEIATELGICVKTVIHILERRSPHLMGYFKKDERDTRIVELRGLGWTYKQIAKDVNVSISTVGNVLKECRNGNTCKM